MPKLTQRFVDSLRADGGDRIVFDSELRGFGVRVLRSGRKSWLIAAGVTTMLALPMVTSSSTGASLYTRFAVAVIRPGEQRPWPLRPGVWFTAWAESSSFLRTFWLAWVLPGCSSGGGASSLSWSCTCSSS